MKFIADLHIHSRYSRATSKELTFPELYRWALYKGIHVLGTGDFTHPAWQEEMDEFLMEAPEQGLYMLKPEYAREIQKDMPAGHDHSVRFLLSVEISNIYKKDKKTRKIHNVFFAPNLEIAKKVRKELCKIGNLDSDGRPILGLDCRHLFEMMLDISPEIYLIPAHVWTPWFSVLGAKSGFDDISECFEDLTKYIFAIETGLSSDPPMNWLCSCLDPYTLVSNSDAHSARKIGREANLFNCEMSYPGLFEALKIGVGEKFLGTIEFYPEEGKYHLSGHRKCAVRMTPEQALESKGLCPVCGKPVTMGVMNRVAELADRNPGEKAPRACPFESLVALETVLSEVLSVGVGSKKVQNKYQELLQKFGTEMEILRNIPLDSLRKEVSEVFAEAIERVRAGKLHIDAGYDGEFGSVKIFAPGEREKYLGQDTFFSNWEPEKSDSSKKLEKKLEIPQISQKNSLPSQKKEQKLQLNPQQKKAIEHRNSPLLIVAGPGTGKTRTLTERIAHLIEKEGTQPQNILAVTFTNKAAEEMQERLEKSLGEKSQEIQISTFHHLALKMVEAHREKLGLGENFSLYESSDLWPLLDSIDKKFQQKISDLKNQLIEPEDVEEQELREAYLLYQKVLREENAIDLDDLVFLAAKLLSSHMEICQEYREKYKVICVDEYQDINHGQYRLLRSLIQEKTDLCVIGDPDQAIYGFRGAQLQYFLNFSRDFPSCQQIHLEQNYRCTQETIQAANALIQNNPSPFPRKLFSEKNGSQSLRCHCHEAPTDKAEAEFVVHTIERLLGGITHFSFDSKRSEAHSEHSFSFKSFAVLYRLHWQSKLLEEAISRSGMPYQIIGGRSLWQKPNLKRWRMLLSLLEDTKRDMECKQLLGELPHIGKQSIQQLKDYAKEKKCPILETIYQSIPTTLSTSAQDSLATFAENMKLCQKIKTPQKILATLIPKMDFWKNEEDEKLLIDTAKRFSSLREFLNYIALHKQSDSFNPQAEKITLMSLHAAKGLEFPVIFIVGCQDSIMPHSFSQEEKDDPARQQEERRLFYVGMTRMQDLLYLVWAKKRTEGIFAGETSPSPYLTEIPEEYKTYIAPYSLYRKKKKSDNQQMTFFAME